MNPFFYGAIFGGAVAGAALQPTIATNFLADIYPVDPAKRQALALCILENPEFNRLSSTSRDSCYQRELTPTLTATRVSTSVAPNPVALEQAPAWQGAPPSDIRVIEATQVSVPRVVANIPQR